MKEMKMNLQLFNEAVKGTKIIFLYRVKSKSAQKAGANIAFVTENGLSISKDADSTATKDGAIRTPGEAEIEVTSTSIFKKGDTVIEELKKAMLDDELLQIWRANLEDAADGTYSLTSDTEVDPSKTYYTRSGSSPDYVYTAVANPVKSSLSSYYELTVTKFKGTYYEGYLTSFEETSNAEDFVEYSLTFGINGKGADGDVTVTTDQQEAAAYVFTDTTQTGA